MFNFKIFKLYNYYCAAVFWKLRRRQIAVDPATRSDWLESMVNSDKKAEMGIMLKAMIQAGVNIESALEVKP
jgi:hypothetical protein